MSINLAKSYAIFRDLSQQLAIRIANATGGRVNTVTNTYDASGNPMIFMSVNGVVTESKAVIALRILPVLNPSPTIFGQPLASGDPSDIQFAYELNGSGFPIPSVLDIILALYQTVPVGTRMDVLTIANGTAVNETSMNAAALAGPAESFENLYWPGSGNV